MKNNVFQVCTDTERGWRLCEWNDNNNHKLNRKQFSFSFVELCYVYEDGVSTDIL